MLTGPKTRIFHQHNDGSLAIIGIGSFGLMTPEDSREIMFAYQCELRETGMEQAIYYALNERFEKVSMAISLDFKIVTFVFCRRIATHLKNPEGFLRSTRRMLCKALDEAESESAKLSVSE